jgi:hypothetical protein
MMVRASSCSMLMTISEIGGESENCCASTK